MSSHKRKGREGLHLLNPKVSFRIKIDFKRNLPNKTMIKLERKNFTNHQLIQSQESERVLH